MLKKRARKRFVSEINVVPYIDVMLVLLVIFMVTAPLLQQGVEVELPVAATKNITSGEKEAVIMSINEKGDYFLNISHTPQVPIEGSVLQEHIIEVLKQDPKRSIVVKGDKNVDYGKVMGAMVLLQKAGVPNVGLLTKNE
jgi:biopolymer transport protein TolR